jgi:hypothetical protein
VLILPTHVRVFAATAVDGGSKLWRGAAEFGGAGLLNVSVGSRVSRESRVGQSWAR